MSGIIILVMCYVSMGLALTLGNRAGSHYHHNHRLRIGDQSIGAPNNKLSGGESSDSLRLTDLPEEWSIYERDPFSRDFIDNTNNKLSPIVNNNKLLSSTGNMENVETTRRDSPGTGRHSSAGRSYNDNNKGFVDDDFTEITRASGSDSASAINQYDLNQNVNERSAERHRNNNNNNNNNNFGKSSVWSLEPEYPWKIKQDSRAPGTAPGYSRTLGKRNQVAGGRRKPGESRTSGQQGQPPFLGSSIPEVAMGSMASQLMLRTARGNRQYDVPQIECPSSEDGMERFACPTPDRMGRYRCIDDHVLCDGFIDCPTGEDEDRQACMFYKTTKAHLDVLAEALLRWVRGR